MLWGWFLGDNSRTHQLAPIRSNFTASWDFLTFCWNYCWGLTHILSITVFSLHIFAQQSSDKICYVMSTRVMKLGNKFDISESIPKINESWRCEGCDCSRFPSHRRIGVWPWDVAKLFKGGQREKTEECLELRIFYIYTVFHACVWLKPGSLFVQFHGRRWLMILRL